MEIRNEVIIHGATFGREVELIYGWHIVIVP
jgi:hypothetical protein